MGNNMTCLSRCATALVAACVVLPSHADTVSNEPIVVTATRTAQTADETLSSVSVITRQDIEQSQTKDLVDLLRMENGVDIARAGGPGQQTSVFLRGTNSNHVLVLIDGVRTASPITGSFDWANLPLAQIERIEIVRGPRAALYGSDAIGGVIQIFTRQPKGPTARAEVGSYGTHGLQAGWGGGDTAKFHVTAETFHTNGFPSQNASGFSPDGDSDGNTRRSVSSDLDLPLSARTTLGLNALYSEGNTKYDTGTLDSTNQTLNMRLTDQSADHWTQSLNLGYATDNLDDHSAFASKATTERLMADWQHDFTLTPNNLLSLGLNYLHDQGRNFDTVNNLVQFDRSTHNRGLFSHWQYQAGANEFQLSARHDQHSTFGSHDTGQLSVGRRLAAHWRVFASYGTAFTAPNLNALYSPGSGGFFAGNPNLQPETSRSAELGLLYNAAPGTHLRLSLFHTRVNDLIDFSGGMTDQAININAARLRGIEAELDQRVDVWRLQGNLTLQQAQNANTDTDLLRRPKAKLDLRLSHALGDGGDVGIESYLSAGHADINNLPPAYGINRVGGYGLVNLSLRYPVQRDWNLEGRLENLLDKTYEQISGYNTPGRSLFVALSYSPGSATR